MTPHHTPISWPFRAPGRSPWTYPHPDCGVEGSGTQPAVLDRAHLSLLVSRRPLGGGGAGESRCCVCRPCPAPGPPPGSLGAALCRVDSGCPWATLPKGKGGASGGPPATYRPCFCPCSHLFSLETKPLLPALPPHPSLGRCSVYSPPACGLPAQGGSALSSWHRPS